MNSMHALTGGKSRKIAPAGTSSMEPQLAPTAADRIDPDVSSPSDAGGPQFLRIQAYLDAQRAKLAAIQHELAEQIGRLSRERGQAVAGSQCDPAERAELQRMLDQSRAECEQSRSRLAEAERELPQLRQDAEASRRETQRLGAENQRLV